jgi:tetratricopeptide (TPR) repeat protein
MGKPKDAAGEYHRAIVVREKLLQEQPFPAFRSELARCYGSLGQVLDLAGDLPAALAAFQRAMADREKLTDANPHVPEYRFDLALSYKELADIFKQSGDLDSAFDWLSKSVDTFDRLATEFDQTTRYQYGLAVARGELAWLLRRHKGQPELALNELKLAWTALEKIVRGPSGTAVHKFALAQTYGQCTLLHQQAEEFATALEWFDQSNRVLDPLVAETPETPDYPMELSINYINMVYCRQMTGQLEDSLEDLVKAIAIRKRLTQAFPQVPEYRKLFDKSKQDLASSIALLRDRPLPTTPEQGELARQRQVKWEAWANEHADIRELGDLVSIGNERLRMVQL